MVQMTAMANQFCGKLLGIGDTSMKFRLFNNHFI